MFFSRTGTPALNEAAAALSRGTLQLVDVRESVELAEARVTGATRIPLGRRSARLGELDRNRPVALPLETTTRTGAA